MTPIYANPKHRPTPKPAPEQIPMLDLRWSGGDDPESFGLARTEMRGRSVAVPITHAELKISTDYLALLNAGPK